MGNSQLKTVRQEWTQTDFDKQIGKNLKRIRELHDLSQTEIGKHIGLHQTAVCRVESGKQKLTFAEGLMIAELLAINPNDLIQELSE